MKKIYLVGEINDKIINGIKDLGCEPINKVVDEKDVIGVVVRGQTPINKTFINKLPKLKFIIAASIGIDHIDISHAKMRDVLVANCPTANVESTAEHAFGLLFSGMKNVVKSTNELHRGIWDRKTNLGHQLRGKSVGILGYGKIGAIFARLCFAVGVKIYVLSRSVTEQHLAHLNGVKVHDMDELCSHVNYLSVHLPLTQETMNLVNYENIKLLKKPNGIVNTARGGIVNEKDIIKALDEGILDFYAADVFENEPNPDPKLIQHPKVLSTPHIAANTYEAQDQIAEDVLEQLGEIMQGRAPQNLIE